MEIVLIILCIYMYATCVASTGGTTDKTTEKATSSLPLLRFQKFLNVLLMQEDNHRGHIITVQVDTVPACNGGTRMPICPEEGKIDRAVT